MPTGKHRPMICDLCGSTNIYTVEDIGFDIDPSGEERQHLDHCKDCGAKRFWVFRVDYEDSPDEDGLYEGWYEGWNKWVKSGDNPFFPSDES